MKIAHVVATLPPDIGGMGQVAFDEARGLAARGYEVTVFTMNYPYSHYQDNKLPFKVIRENPKVRSGAAGFIPSWRRRLSEFDLVHLHYPFYGGAEWVWSCDKPYVATYHMDAEPTGFLQRIVKTLYNRLLSERILQKAKRVMVVDDAHVLKYKPSLFPEQIAVLPNGIDTTVFRPQMVTAAELGLPELQNKEVFLFVGNLLPVKGFSLLLAAFRSMPENAHLLVIGAGFREHTYRQSAEKIGVADRIHWLGPVYDPSQLAKYYNLASAAVVPSLSESFSLVAAESLACERPVIASDIPGVRGRVIDNETGLLFKKGSAKDLEFTLKKFLALSPAERGRLGKAGRELVEMRFRLDKHLDILEKIYATVV